MQKKGENNERKATCASLIFNTMLDTFVVTNVAFLWANIILGFLRCWHHYCPGKSWQCLGWGEVK